MKQHPAYFTFDEVALKHGFRLWYFAPVNRAPPPYRKQVRVTAVIDIAEDGSLAGVELIDDQMPLPHVSKPAPDDFMTKVAAAKARYDALPPDEKMRHDYEQRRSFVRGMCPDDHDFTEWCKIVDRQLPPLTVATTPSTNQGGGK